MSTEVSALDTDVHLDYALWALETGLWDGRTVDWKDAKSFLTEVEQKITSYLANQDPTSPFFDQIGARLAWLGTHPNSQSLLAKDIQALQVTLEGSVVQAGIKKSVSKFWKKHKTEIIIGAAILAVVTVIVIVAVSTGGTGATLASTGGGGAIKMLSDMANHQDELKKHTNAPLQIEKPVSTAIESSFYPFEAEGISIDGQFTSYQDILKNPHPDSLFCTPYKYQDPSVAMGPSQFPTYKPLPSFPETYTPPPLNFALPSDMQPMQAPISSTPPPLYDLFTKPPQSSFLPPKNPSSPPVFGVESLDSLFQEKPLVFDVPPRYPQVGGINGMNTSLENCLSHISYLNRIAQNPDQNLQYELEWVRDKSHGFFIDLAEIIGMNFLGYSPNTAPELRANWTYFHNANLDNPNAKYLQFGHSKGMIDIRNALADCPKEIRDRVIVVGIAPAAILPDDACFDSYHYATINDIVPLGEVSFFYAFDTNECGISPITQHKVDLLDRLIIVESEGGNLLSDHDFQNPIYQPYILKHLTEHIANDGIYIKENK